MADQLTVSIISRNIIGCEGLRRIVMDSGLDIQQCVTSNRKMDCSGWVDTSNHIVVVDGESIQQAFDVIAQIRSELTNARIAILCSDFDVASIKRAFGMGVDGVLLADMRPAALAVAFRLIALGEKAMPSELPDLLLAEHEHFMALPRHPGSSSIKLNQNERDILRFVASGETNKAIGEMLNCTEAAVKAHIKVILRKLHVINRTQAATWAYCHGLVNGYGNSVGDKQLS